MKYFKTGNILSFDSMYYVLLGEIEDIRHNKYYAFYATLKEPTLDGVLELLKDNVYPYYYSIERFEQGINYKYVGQIDDLDLILLKMKLSDSLEIDFKVLK